RIYSKIFVYRKYFFAQQTNKGIKKEKNKEGKKTIGKVGVNCTYNFHWYSWILKNKVFYP
ncbi:MAG: hypothetical protein AB3N18_07780, partial [Allomuricauda sp.]